MKRRNLALLAVVFVVGCGPNPPTEDSLRDYVKAAIKATKEPGESVLIDSASVERGSDIHKPYVGKVRVSHLIRKNGKLIATYLDSVYSWDGERWSLISSSGGILPYSQF